MSVLILAGEVVMSEFISDIDAIRKRARKHMEAGTVTESYGADRNQVVRVLNDVLATEFVCVPAISVTILWLKD
jgi:bacterioferritin